MSTLIDAALSVLKTFHDEVSSWTNQGLLTSIEGHVAQIENAAAEDVHAGETAVKAVLADLYGAFHGHPAAAPTAPAPAPVEATPVPAPAAPAAPAEPVAAPVAADPTPAPSVTEASSAPSSATSTASSTATETPAATA